MCILLTWHNVLHNYIIPYMHVCSYNLFIVNLYSGCITIFFFHTDTFSPSYYLIVFISLILAVQLIFWFLKSKCRNAAISRTDEPHYLHIACHRWTHPLLSPDVTSCRSNYKMADTGHPVPEVPLKKAGPVTILHAG